MAGSSHKAWLRKGHHLPWSWPPPPSAPLWLPPISSLSAADKREPRCIAGESSGSPQSTRGLQTFFGRASVAVASPGPCGPREAAALPRARNPPHPTLPHLTPPLLPFCIVFTCLTDTEPIIISFPQGAAPFVCQTLQTVSILSPAAMSPLL